MAARKKTRRAATATPVNLRPRTLDWALKHVEQYGDTDIFPAPFEFKAIRSEWKARRPGGTKQRVVVRDWLSAIDLLNWQTRTPRRCLSPKHQFGFRASMQPDPIDSLLYAGLVYEIGRDLEAVRINAAERVVHSYRFNPNADGRMFDPDFNYESFRKRSVELARDNDCEWVVVADIADFYPRIYSHPLENALSEATTRSGHVTVLKRMLSSWNYTVSYGVPVGPAASRLLAEVAIADVDAALQSEGLVHTRFVDDYRVFCSTERAAYSALAFLANTLFENHGLTLQQHKTYIQPAADFLDANEASETELERKSLAEKFEDIVNNLGLERYEPIDYDELGTEHKELIDALNLKEILEGQIEKDGSLDVLLVRFVLRRLAQLNDDSAVDLVLGNMKRLYPVFKEALEYSTAIRTLFMDRHSLGARLLDLIDEEVVGHLEYHRAWILSTFANDADWNNADRFAPLYNEHADLFSRRELVLAMGKAGKSAWFKSKKRHFGSFEIWERRAFLAAASCLPGDEADHWYRSVAGQLDDLEKVVVDWARRSPIC